MSVDDISTPPKERIMITYKTETGGVPEQKELPNKLLMLGDYTLQEDSTRLVDRKPIRVHRDTFDEVMAKQDLRLTINVPDCLAEDNADHKSEFKVDLKFNSLKDFEPARVASQVPELKKLLELREALVALKAPLGNIRDFRESLETLLNDDDRRTLLAELVK